MSSIFAWNMRGFIQPCKQKAVRRWTQAAKLSFGCMLETKVRVGNFRKCLMRHFQGGAVFTIILITIWEGFGFVGPLKLKSVRCS